MKNAKDRCNFALGMAAIWTIVFGIVMVCFMKWDNLFTGIVMVFSYFKVVTYAHQAGFNEAGYKMLEAMESMGAVLNRGMKKGLLSEDVRRKSADNDQNKSVQKDNCD